MSTFYLSVGTVVAKYLVVEIFSSLFHLYPVDAEVVYARAEIDNRIFH